MIIEGHVFSSCCRIVLLSCHWRSWIGFSSTCTAVALRKGKAHHQSTCFVTVNTFSQPWFFKYPFFLMSGISGSTPCWTGSEPLLLKMPQLLPPPLPHTHWMGTRPLPLKMWNPIKYDLQWCFLGENSWKLLSKNLTLLLSCVYCRSGMLLWWNLSVVWKVMELYMKLQSCWLNSLNLT